MRRRDVLKAAPAVAIAAAMPAVALAAEDDMTEALIADHQLVYGEFCKVCAMTDDAKRADNPLWRAALTVEEAALFALCAYAPPTQAGREAKVAYMVEKVGGLDDEHFVALIRSIAG